MSNELTCYIQAVEVCTPGMMNWQMAKDIFLGHQLYQCTEAVVPCTNMLPARENRRASSTIHLSLHIAEKLQQQAQIEANTWRSVLASSDGDMDIFHYLSQTLSQTEPAISPTLFHQSLHNSAAGCLHIAAKSQQASVSISAGNDTFSAGLLTSMIEVCTASLPVLFVAYNMTSPPPMNVHNPMLTWFGSGFIFTPEQGAASIAKLTCSLVDKQDETILSLPSLNDLRLGNPIARCLPLLEHLAHQGCHSLYLNYLDQQSLKIQIQVYST